MADKVNTSLFLDDADKNALADVADILSDGNQSLAIRLLIRSAHQQLIELRTGETLETPIPTDGQPTHQVEKK